MEFGERADKAKESLRKAVVPGAASIVGAGAGLLLTKRNRQLRAALPSLDDLGIRNIADDLRGRLDGVLGNESSTNASPRSSGNGRSALDPAELASRRKQREERRSGRREGVGA